MYWRDITEKHNNCKVSVSAKSTPKSPYRGEGPFVGYIQCRGEDAVPVLVCGDMFRSFAWYWEVEFLS